MTSIGIIGANGHVGSEVCLYLSMFEGVDVVPICRDQVASAFLRRMGLNCRHGSVADRDQAGELLKGLDLIADFSMPAGTVSEIVGTYRRGISGIVGAAPPSAKFVCISTIMAFGASARQELKARLFSRTIYGYTKRVAERIALGLARASGREAWVLRLGIVYGLLQPSSQGLQDSIGPRPIGVPPTPSYTVFCFTIAEALAHIAKGEEAPGRYTLVSVPQYSWEEVYRHHAAARGVSPIIDVVDWPEVPRGPKRILARLRGLPAAWISQCRDLLTAYVLSKFPAWEKPMRASWLVGQARSEIGGLAARRVTIDVFRGNTIPGPFLRTLSDPRVAMPAYEKKLRERLTAMWDGLDAPVRTMN